MHTTSLLHNLLKQLTSDTYSMDGMDSESLTAYRQTLAAIAKAANMKMALASSKSCTYDDDDITDYINDILSDGYALKATALSDVPDMENAQRLKRYASLIASVVEESGFGTKQFNIYDLRHQRSAIARAKTLHELRKAVSCMIGPLKLWREHQALLEATSPAQQLLVHKAARDEIECVMLELKKSKELSQERKRVIDELLSCYDEGAGNAVLLRNCETAKKEHGLSDVEAAKMFGITRWQLQRLRDSIVLS